MRKNTRFTSGRWVGLRRSAVPFLVLCAVWPASAAVAEDARWTPLGPAPIKSSPISSYTGVEGMTAYGNPVVGAMNMVLEAPENPGTLYVGTANGGVWKSVDAGGSWTPLTDRLSSLSIGDMTFDRSDPDKLYIGFGKQSNYSEIGGPLNSIRLSTDGGATWTSPDTNNVLIGKDIVRLAVDGLSMWVGIKNPEAGKTGLYLSTTGGAGLRRVETTSGLAAGIISDLRLDPADSQIVYASVVGGAAGNGAYKSTDGGATWAKLALPAAGNATQRILLAVSGTTLAAGVVNGKEADATVFYRSTDGGATWISMKQPVTRDKDSDNGLPEQGLWPGGQFNNAALYIDPTDPNVIYVSGDRQPDNGSDAQFPNSIGAQAYSGRVFRGTYNPATGTTRWEPLTHVGTNGNSAPHADSRSIFVDSTGRLIQTDDGGIYALSNPRGKGDWTPLNGNIQVSEVDASSWNPLANVAVAGMQDNGTAYQIKAGTVWATIDSGDGGANAVNYRTYEAQGIAVLYGSSQYMGSLVRCRMNRDGSVAADSVTVLNLYHGDQKLNNNKTELTFYPSLTLNRNDQARFAVGGYSLFLGQDDPAKLVKSPETLRIDVVKVVDKAAVTGITNLGFNSVAYGAKDRPDAILAGVGDMQYGAKTQKEIDDGSYYGQLWYSDDVTKADPVRLTTFDTAATATDGKTKQPGNAVQTLVFDGKNGSGYFYVADGTSIWRGERNGKASLAEAYDFDRISAGLPANFIARRAVEYVSHNGVNALLAGGLHMTTTDTTVNPIYYTLDPAANDGAVWTPLGKLLPNAPIFNLHYSDIDDILLTSTLGRGLFALYDFTTYFPEAASLTFGAADNDSAPEPSRLTDGNVAGGRALIKTGSGALILPNAKTTYSGGTEFRGGVVAAYSDESFGTGNWTFDGGALAYLNGFGSSRTVRLDAGGGVFDTNGKQAVLSGVIGGVGGLVLTGGGTLVLKGANTYTGETLVDNGQLLIGNTAGSATGTGNVYIKPTGSVGGKGSISGNLVNTGEADPGESVGVLTVGGDYTQQASGTMLVEVDASGSDLLKVGGQATLDGRLKTVPLNGFRPAPGSRYKIIEAASVSGRFSILDTAVEGSRTLVFKPRYLSTEVDIVAERDYANGGILSSMTANQRATALMLNSVADTAGGDLDVVLGAVDRLPSDGQVTAAMDQMAPRGEAVQAALAFNGASLQAGVVNGRLSDLRAGASGVNLQALSLTIEQDEGLNRHGRPIVLAFNGEGLPAAEVFKTAFSRDWGFFIRGNGTFGDLKTTSTNRFRNYGLTVGGDYRVSKTFVAGLMGGYTRGRSDLDDAGSTAKTAAYSLGVYGTYYNGGFYVDGQVQCGWNAVDKERRIVFPGIDRTAVSDQKGRLLTMAGDLGYDIPVRHWILTPMLSVEYIRLATEDYTESGAGALNLTVAGQSTKLLQGHAGGSVAYVWKVGEATLTPRVWALYGHEFDADETAGVTARLAMGSASFTTAVASPDRDFVTVGGQAVLTLPQDRSLYVNVSGQMGRSDSSALNVGLGFRMSF